MRKLTVAFALVVIRDEVRSWTDAVRIRGDTRVVQKHQPIGTCSALVRRGSCAGLALRGTRRTSGPRAETSIWANSPTCRRLRSGIASGLVIGVGGESGLAGGAQPGPVLALPASAIAD